MTPPPPLHATTTPARNTITLLAAWLVGALAYAMPFGWRAWVGDVAWLALLVLCVAVVWRHRPRHPARQAWSRWDAAFLAGVAVAFSVPALIVPVPLDTDAQGFGHLALAARDGGDLTSLAPYEPEITYLYAPGFPVLAAYVSARAGALLHTVQLALGAAFATLVVAALRDLGAQAGGVLAGRATALASLVGVGLLTAFMDSHYTTLLGLTFAVAFLSYAYDVAHAPPGARPWRTALPGACVCLAALVLAHPDTTIITALLYGGWLLLLPLARPHPTWRRQALLWTLVPAGALLLLLPWLLTVGPLLGGSIASPFERAPFHLALILGVPPHTLYHGPLIVLLAALGVAWGVRQRQSVALMALGGWLLVTDFAATGLLERALPWLVGPVLRYDYPFSIAWHGPIVPYALGGGLALAWLARRVALAARTGWALAWAGLGVMVLAAGLAGVGHGWLLNASKGRVAFYGAFASHADVQVALWLRQHAAPGAYLLNAPGPQEGDWVPVIAERRAVYYRPQPFFHVPGQDDPLADTPPQAALRAFWDDPANPAHADLLARWGVTHVVVPQVLAAPTHPGATLWRWRPPFPGALPGRSRIADARYLRLLYARDGAAAYALE